MKTSLIIPAYYANQRLVELTARCLASLEPDPELEVILVDDGSPIRAMLDHTTIDIRLEENGGYAKAANTGLEAAGGDVLVLGNNDLVFPENWLRGLLRVLEEGFDIATCWTSDQDYELEAVIKPGDKFGSLFAMTRGVYDALGGFDEQFRGYFSDTDYRRRALDAGFRIGMNYGLVVPHEGKATYMQTDPDDHEYLWSMRLYEIKHGRVE